MRHHAKICTANGGRPPARGNPQRAAPDPAATTRRDCASEGSSGQERKPSVHRKTAHELQELGRPRRVFLRSKRPPNSAPQRHTDCAPQLSNKSRAKKSLAPPARSEPRARKRPPFPTRARPLSLTRAHAPTKSNAGHPRPTKAAAKAAALVHTNAAAANVLVLAATAALSVANKQASDLATMQLQQTQARRQERFRQPIQQHHQMRRARSSCINQRSNCRRRQVPYRLQQPPAPQHSPTKPGRVHFHNAIVTRLRVYNPGKPAAAFHVR